MEGNSTTAGIIIIDNKIIKGQGQNANSVFLAQRLHQLGVEVKVIIIIPDDLDVISSYVKKFADNYTHVFTTGGIGPTDDDIGVVYEAVAKAFGDETEVNNDLEQMYKDYFEERYTESHRKLARIPKGATLVENPQGFPITSLKNTHVLPGGLNFLEQAFRILESWIEVPSASKKVKTLHLNVDEMSVVADIVIVKELFQWRVALGSYPEWGNNYYKMRIDLKSTNESDLKECESKLREVIPQCNFVSYDEHPKNNSMEKLKGLADSMSNMNGLLENTIAVFHEALTKYRPAEICLAFNGGKDCTVLLHIWYAVLKERHPDEQINAIYIRSEAPFSELETFIQDSIVRVSDPHGGSLKSFHPTDKGWPEYMRVNPILKWQYNDIWHFMRQLSLPYCSLYDMGYTSLGSKENTIPNPALRYLDRNNIERYKPAYMLVLDDDKEERVGRIPKSSG